MHPDPEIVTVVPTRNNNNNNIGKNDDDTCKNTVTRAAFRDCRSKEHGKKTLDIVTDAINQLPLGKD